MASGRRSPRPVVESLRSARAAAACGTPAGSALPGSAAPSPQRDSRTSGQDPDPVVRISALISKPTSISLAATSADFHRDASVWESTPVRASQQYEYNERLDYAFTYGEELSKLCRTHTRVRAKAHEDPYERKNWSGLELSEPIATSCVAHMDYQEAHALATNIASDLWEAH
ncbi:hypothetical protein CYMTET_42832 [Cymbomonas tetramitiformis]|uniref:Uncharacterized protein n=1 Tax=Cymbomonas tetramitiformis TaxID=36881 RepID=A0AAE0C3D6_9CHLO|nr:hypothetical protein CYMTET_42832 [Cymbomonas tetramitiformis]